MSTESTPDRDAPSDERRDIGILGNLVVVFLALTIPLIALTTGLGFHLAIGWLVFAHENVSRAVVRWDGVLMFGVATLLFAILLHRIAHWLRRGNSNGNAARWRLTSTGLVTGLILVAFVAGTALVCIAHQLIWLATDDEPLYAERIDAHGDARSQVKQIGVGMMNLHDTYDGFHATYGENEVPQSWATDVGPQLVNWIEIDRTKPWDHPANRSEASKLYPSVLNPDVAPLVLRNDEGFGVTHYVGNVHVLDPRDASLNGLEDASNTLLIGEITAGIPPWAKPGTGRDPALGINRSPEGFGSPRSNRGALFVMADGSVRELSRDTDVDLLRRLGRVP